MRPMAESPGPQLSLLMKLSTVLLNSILVVNGQYSGVFISLNGVTIPNDGYVLVSDIGTHGSGLHCNTDRSDCCRGSDHPNYVAQGHWYRPNGSEVMSFTVEDAITPTRSFFSRDRVAGIIRLNRNGIPPDRGRFRCEIPNADGVNVTLYVNIVNELPTIALPQLLITTTTSQTTELATTTQPSTTAAPPTTSSDAPTTTAPPPPVSVDVAPITFSGTTVGGDIHMLTCFVTVTGSTEQPTITWMVNDAEISSSDAARTVSVTSGSAGRYSSTLTFNPLAASHAGTYTCRATLGNAMDTALRTVDVQNPTITISITSSVAAPVVGSMYSLTCVVTGVGRLINNNAMVTYLWLKNDAVVSGQTMATLSFSPLTFFDAGRYTCWSTITSSLLSAPITTSMANPVSIRLTLPAPTVTLMSDLTGNVVVVGSTVTLTCTVTMNQTVRESDLIILTVDTRLSVLGGESRALTGPRVTGTTFTYTTQLNSFRRSDSRNYICRSTVRPQPEISSYLMITASSPVASQALGLISSDISVYLSLHGRIHAGNSYVDIDDIGEEDEAALLCVTNLTQCCRGSDTPDGVGALGVWLYPNGTEVLIQSRGDDFYRNRDRSVVRLNRRNNAISPTGLYCCEVPDASNTQQRVCANIVLEVPTTPEPAMSTYTTPQSPTTTNSGAFCPSPAEAPSPCTCSSEVGIAVGALLLVEGIIAVVTAIIVVYCCLVIRFTINTYNRRRKSGKSDFAVSTNMAYGQVKLEGLGDVGGEYENPDRLARPGQGGGGCEPTERPAPSEFPAEKVRKE